MKLALELKLSYCSNKCRCTVQRIKATEKWKRKKLEIWSNVIVSWIERERKWKFRTQIRRRWWKLEDENRWKWERNEIEIAETSKSHEPRSSSHFSLCFYAFLNQDRMNLEHYNFFLIHFKNSYFLFKLPRHK